MRYTPSASKPAAVARKAHLIEAQVTVVRYFALDGTDHPTHKAQARMIHRCVCWWNCHTDARRPHEIVNRGRGCLMRH